MAYIFKVNPKYYILKDLGDNLADLHLRKDVFEIDELLAFPVAELCNKGYITEMCCSGHAFGSPYFKEIENDKELDSIEDVLLLCEYLPDYEGSFACCQGQPEPGAFIKFAKDIKFQNIPEGWTYEKSFLRLDLPMQKNPSHYYAKLTMGILALTEWIESLPDLNSKT